MSVSGLERDNVRNVEHLKFANNKQADSASPGAIVKTPIQPDKRYLRRQWHLVNNRLGYLHRRAEQDWTTIRYFEQLRWKLAWQLQRLEYGNHDR